jgi:hypothetical protein
MNSVFFLKNIRLYKKQSGKRKKIIEIIDATGKEV